MAVINFRSVGKTASQIQDETSDETVLPVGIMTPLRLGTQGEGIFAMHFDVADQVHDNLHNLILTNWGDRLGNYEFGANLRELTTELASISNFEDEAVIRIKTAVTKWMPFVSLSSFEMLTDHEQNIKTGIINFRVIYDILPLNVFNRALEVRLFVI